MSFSRIEKIQLFFYEAMHMSLALLAWAAAVACILGAISSLVLFLFYDNYAAHFRFANLVPPLFFGVVYFLCLAAKRVCQNRITKIFGLPEWFRTATPVIIGKHTKRNGNCDSGEAFLKLQQVVWHNNQNFKQ